MPLYMANPDFAQVKKPFVVRSKTRIQMIGLGAPGLPDGLTYTSSLISGGFGTSITFGFGSSLNASL
jgi:hypothetical protein